MTLGAKKKSELGQLNHVNQRQPSTGTNGARIHPPRPEPQSLASERAPSRRNDESSARAFVAFA